MVPRRTRRNGLSLLELIIASTMMAMVMATVMVVLRTGRQAWDAHEGDYIRVESAHATLRHIVRQIRQADAVEAISAAGDNSGRLALRMSNGDVHAWDHASGSNRVNYGVNVGTPTQLLAPEVTGLRFSGLQADGATATTIASEVQCLRVDVTVSLPRETGGVRTVSSWGWIRSW